MTSVALAFMPKPVIVQLDNLLPSRAIPRNALSSHKFQQIKATIEEIDLIEPLSVTPVDRKSGNMRVLALRELGRTEAPCLIATDDESYTYNNKLSRLSTVQEHVMYRQAVERGVSPERLAKVGCVDVSVILSKVNLLDGICREAAEMLKDRQFSVSLTGVLRQMTPVRQVECVDLMLSANNVTGIYAKSLLAATPPEMLVAGRLKKKQKSTGVSQEQMARMQREMTNVQQQYKLAEQSYGEDMLNLVLTRGYVVKLLENSRVARFLEQFHADVLTQFNTLIKTTSMDLQA